MNMSKNKIVVAGFALASISLFAGCGGGGGGSTPVVLVTNTNLHGTLLDTSTLQPLGGRTVTITTGGTVYTTTSAADGTFTLVGVPDGSQTLVVKDSVGSTDGTVVENVSQNGGTQELGNIKFDISSFPPPPPI